MHGMRDSDWQTATAAEKTLLHDAANSARQARNLSWKEFFRKALPRDPVAEGYEKNFRRGRISAARAAKIYRWLQANEPDIASDFDRKILEARKAAGISGAELTWDGFVRLNGLFERVEVLALKPGAMPIVEFAEDDPVEDLKLILRQKFYFRIDSPMTGTIAALQTYKGRWYPLPLTKTDPLLAVAQTRVVAPADVTTGKPEPLFDRSNIGEHGFAFVIASDEVAVSLLRHAVAGQEVPREILKTVVNALWEMDAKRFCVLRCNVMIRP